MKIIKSENAPPPVGPYSQAVEANHTLYISGQIGLDPQTTEMKADFAAQSKQIFNNLLSILNEAGYQIQHLVKLNIFVTDLANFSTLNTIMIEALKGHKPARSTVQVAALPLTASVEIDAIACKQ